MNFTSKSKRLGLALCLCTTIFAMAGCGSDSNNESSASSTATDTVKQIADTSSTAEKLDRLSPYVEATNGFNGNSVTFSFAIEPVMNKMRAGQDLTSFSSPSFDTLKKNLEKAQQQESGYSDIDQATKDVLEKLEKLVPLTEKLESYYQSKQYSVDGNAEGRKMAAEYLVLYDAFAPSYEALDGAISKHNSELHDARIEEIKAAGKKNAAISMEIARDMRLAVNAINPAAAPDTYKANVEEKIANIMHNMGEFQPKDAGAANSFKTSANSTIGYIRDFMTKPEDRTYNDMVKAYNRFIDTVNRLDIEKLD